MIRQWEQETIDRELAQTDRAIVQAVAASQDVADCNCRRDASRLEWLTLALLRAIFLLLLERRGK